MLVFLLLIFCAMFLGSVISPSKQQTAPAVFQSATPPGPTDSINQLKEELANARLRAEQAERQRDRAEGDLIEDNKERDALVEFSDDLDSMAGQQAFLAGFLKTLGTQNETGSATTLVRKYFYIYGRFSEVAFKMAYRQVFGGGVEHFIRLFERYRPFVFAGVPASTLRQYKDLKPLLAKPIDWRTVGLHYLTWYNDCAVGSTDSEDCTVAEKGMNDAFGVELTHQQLSYVGSMYRIWLFGGEDENASKLLEAVQKAGRDLFEVKGL